MIEDIFYMFKNDQIFNFIYLTSLRIVHWLLFNTPPPQQQQKEKEIKTHQNLLDPTPNIITHIWSF